MRSSKLLSNKTKDLSTPKAKNTAVNLMKLENAVDMISQPYHEINKPAVSHKKNILNMHSNEKEKLQTTSQQIKIA